MAKKYMHKVQHWDDERSIGNSLIVSLKDGWEFGMDPFEKCHVEGFDTVSEARTGIRGAIPCECDICKERGNS